MAADDRRARLAEAIGKLALAIVADTCEPDIVELRILAQLCDEHQLPVEAARIRRWMAAS
jgi:hypothetical protein